MARLPRLILAGIPHLLVQRAQHGQPMCRDDVDLQGFVDLCRELLARHRIELHAFAVDATGFDLLATPGSATDLSGFMQALSRRYSMAFNRRHGRTGGLWEGRYRIAPVEPGQDLLDGMLFIEQRPPSSLAGVGLWRSSAAHHQGRTPEPGLTDPPVYWALGNTPFERELAYRELAAQPLSPVKRSRFEAALKGGWVIGSPDFISGVQRRQPRRPQPKSRGRPVRSV